MNHKQFLALTASSIAAPFALAQGAYPNKSIPLTLSFPTDGNAVTQMGEFL